MEACRVERGAFQRVILTMQKKNPSLGGNVIKIWRDLNFIPDPET